MYFRKNITMEKISGHWTVAMIFMPTALNNGLSTRICARFVKQLDWLPERDAQTTNKSVHTSFFDSNESVSPCRINSLHRRWRQLTGFHCLSWSNLMEEQKSLCIFFQLHCGLSPCLEKNRKWSKNGRSLLGVSHSFSYEPPSPKLLVTLKIHIFFSPLRIQISCFHWIFMGLFDLWLLIILSCFSDSCICLWSSLQNHKYIITCISLIYSIVLFFTVWAGQGNLDWFVFL